MIHSWCFPQQSMSSAFILPLRNIFFSDDAVPLDLFGSLEMSISAICHICYHKAWLIKLVEIETMCSSSKEEKCLIAIKPVTEMLVIQCLSAISYTCFLQASSVPIETINMCYHPSSSLRAKSRSSSLHVIPFSS